MSIWKLLYRLEGSPSYCNVCGRKLLAVRTPIAFDRHTGKPTRIEVRVRCSDPDPEPPIYHYSTSWTEKLVPEDIPLLVETPQLITEEAI